MRNIRYSVLFAALAAGCTSGSTTDLPALHLDAGPRDAQAADTGALAQPDAHGPLTEDSGPITPAGDAGVEVDSGRTTDMDGAVSLDGGVPDTGPRDTGVDAPLPTTCEPMDLGTAVGASLATGSTAGGSAALTFSCSSPVSPQVYYTWTAPSEGTFVFDTNGSTIDTVLGLYDGCSATADIRCSDDDGMGQASYVAFPMITGQTVLVAVKGYHTDDIGDYVLSIRPFVVEACTGGMDEDLDGEIDCSDSDCARLPVCIESNCTDGVDNDMDGDIDCSDGNCETDPACFESDCTNGVDDDGDGAIDCTDYLDCYGQIGCIEVDCSDGVDDDADTEIDCEDFDCHTAPECMELNCGDSVDNDGDGDADCDDYDCVRAPECGGEFDCNNRMDDNGDGEIDCDDSDCYDYCQESHCSDGRDDDRDGLTDCEDEECSCNAACAPSVPMMCPTGNLGSAVGPSVATGSLAFLTCSAIQTGCGGSNSGGEVTYQWTAPSAGMYTFSTVDPGTTFDTVLAVRGDCGAVDLECNDDSMGETSSEVTVPLTAGEMIVIVVDSYSEYSSGNYVLSITGPTT